MRDGEAEVALRVARLDEFCADAAERLGSGNPAPTTTAATELLGCFVDVVGHHTLELLDAHHTQFDQPGPQLTPEKADAQVARSRALAMLWRWAPETVTGPLRMDAQHWISHGHPSQPTQARFVKVVAAEGQDGVGEKPVRVGFFTSTGAFAGRSMWRAYLAQGVERSLFRRPWVTWVMVPAPDVRVFEVTTATRWAELVCAYGVERDGLLLPDWRLVARDYNAVHMSAWAVLATQGFRLVTDRGSLVAPSWDVESTLWLDWCFVSHGLVCVTTEIGDRPEPAAGSSRSTSC